MIAGAAAAYAGLMGKKNSVSRARTRLRNWSARGSSCPICNKEFRDGCNHSITQAYERLERNVVNAMIDAKLKKALAKKREFLKRNEDSMPSV